ncbi:rRNA maturation RNase YbeY [Athalassotoga sp.]|uniref:rRNA maturation RNase YbeY n=1 Tax=Athalassotoga sp. TaxID=2022597 RepID=UPI003D00F3CF
MPIRIFNDQKVNLNLPLISTLLEKVLNAEKENGIIDLIFVDIDEIVRLNSYRKKSGPTDVLSFNYDQQALKGEVYVCPDYVMENAKIFNVTFNQELLRVCIHGILHVCGYDHERDKASEKIMFEKQENYLSGFADFLNDIC